MVECDGKVCMMSGSCDKTMKVWDLESQSVMATLDNHLGIYAIAIFVNGNRACMATGDHANNVKLWMK